MSDYLATRDIPFFVVIGPELYQVKNFKEGYPYRRIHQNLFALNSSKMKVLDPLPTFAYHLRKAPSDYMVTSYDSHIPQHYRLGLQSSGAIRVHILISGSRSLRGSQWHVRL